MISKHKYDNGVLYLYFDYSYEFGKFNIKKTSKNYITIIYNNVALSIDFEDYIIGVVAAEMPASFNIEALKAQSVIARTYALNLINNGRTLTSDNSTQNYIDINSMKSKWGNDFDKYYNKIKGAVNETKGITIKYNQELIDCVYHSTNNGYTEDSINVWGNDIPYLKSVESPWDKNVSSYLRTISISLEDFNLKLKTNISSDNQISILSRNSSNRVDNIMIGDKVFSGKDFRTILGLRSTDFDISITDNLVNITTRGYGHGVGMSQYGANGMALDGYNYKQILSYYYRGVTIN